MAATSDERHGAGPGAPGGITVVHLLDGPFVTVDGRRIDPPESSAPLLVLLALRDGEAERRQVAAVLWPECREPRATGNLRSALWRLNRAAPGLVLAGRRAVRLASRVAVDVRVVVDRTEEVAHGRVPLAETLLAVPSLLQVHASLLPGWDSAAVDIEREWLRQHVLHALERACRGLLDHHEPAAAAEVAAGLVHAEPLRESAQRLLIEALLAEGNWAEAHRALDAHRRVLRTELGVDVDPGLPELLAAARARPRGVGARPLQ